METHPLKQSVSQLSKRSWGIINGITLSNRVLAKSCLNFGQ
jgi:hypothetical protein